MSLAPSISYLKGFRCIQRCAVLMRHSDVTKFLLSDLLLMIETFHEWGTVGYGRIVSTYTSDWVIDNNLCESNESDIQTCSDYSTVTSHGTVDFRRLARIRGESLRCLHMLSRARAGDLARHWDMFLGEASGRPGLDTIVRVDPSEHARRFALYAMVSLLRSPSLRALCNKVSRTIVKTLEPSLVSGCLRIHQSVIRMLRSGNTEDCSSVRHIISAYASSMPWAFLKASAHSFDDIVGPLVHKVSTSSPEDSLEYLGALSSSLPYVHCNPDVEMDLMQALVRISGFSITDPEMRASVSLNLNTVLVLISPTGTTSIDSSLIVEPALERARELIAMSDDGKKTLLNHLKASLVSVGFLEDLSAPVMRTLEFLAHALQTREPSELLDAFMVGIGRASRKSRDNAQKVLTLNLELFGQSAKFIQSQGDLLFSCFLYGIESDKVRVLSTFMTECLLNPDTSGLALRALMTGLARLRDSQETARRTVSCGLCLNSLKDWLMRSFSDSKIIADERIRADALRTIGLLEPLFDVGREFRASSRESLIESLKSGKTQLMISAISSLNEIDLSDVERQRVGSEIAGLLLDTIRWFQACAQWDYEGGPAVVGRLHVLADGSDLVIKLDQVDLIKDMNSGLVSIASDSRLKILFKYFPVAAKYASRVRNISF